MEKLESFDSWLSSENTVVEKSIPNNIDGYGKDRGLVNKSSHKPLALPDKPFGDIVTSAYANVNVPTRTIPGTSSKEKPNSGNLGCAAAVSLIFFRATGYPLVDNKKIELSTGTMWDFLDRSPNWTRRSNWKTDSQPGDIIITRQIRGRKAGHVGVVVDDNKIISNSSGGFKGDKKGQIEVNYTISGWDSVAKRNPTKTASFTYTGKYRTAWDGPDAEHGKIDGNDNNDNSGNDNIDSPSSTDTEKSWRYINTKRKRSRYYYKVYDKENRRFLTAKYKGDMFKVYNRKGKKVGEVFLRGGSIIMNDEDISQTPVGIGFKHLFEIASKGQVISNGKKDYIVIDGKDKLKINRKGKVKHTYSGDAARNITLIEEEAIRMGVVNPNSIIGMLSVIGKESKFIPKSEKMVYTPGRLAEVWDRFSKTGKRVPKGQGKSNYNELAVQYAGNDQKLANFVYGGRYGNGPESSGDGYKYRGRGFNQITFKGTYKKYGKLLGKNLVGNPDLLNDPNIAAAAAVKFLLNRLKEKNIDPNSFTSTGDAVIKLAGANAGWGKDPSSAIANARKIEPNFSIA
jgi:putative chitinase